MSSSIKAIIFDLDNCLAPAKEVGETASAPVFDAMRAANKGVLSDDVLEKAFADVWRYPLDWVAATHGFSPEMLAAGWSRFSCMEVNHPMYGYGDLDILSALPVDRYLVTSGFRRLQESKINALKIAHLFSGIYIDAIDEPDRLGKKGLFEKIMRENKYTPDEILVVGDSSESEITAGNRLGIKTAQILRAGVPEGDNATFKINNLADLQRLFF